jgi:prepilin-type N-terminal cleavage/methylation domain-containing protein
MPGAGTRLAFGRSPVTCVRAQPDRPKGLRFHGRWPSSPGFTLIEVLMVLAMVSLLVVAASPTFVNLLRDRRVHRAAMAIVDYFRIGRTSAIGRGQPIMVSWNSLGSAGMGGVGQIDVHEAIPTNVGTAPIIASTCNAVTWDAFQPWRGLDLSHQGLYEYAGVTAYDDNCNQIDYAEICFSSTGRMYLRTGSAGAATGPYHQVIAGITFSVLNIKTGLLRPGFVPPNGVARLGR